MTGPPSPVTPDEAIEWHRKRISMSAAEFKALQASARKQAFSVAGIVQESLIADAQAALGAALAEGTTLEDFTVLLGAKFEANWAGTVANPAARIETIFRTNTQSAYNAGRHKQAIDPDMAEIRPFWRYVAIIDARTTPMCRAAHGTVLPSDHPWWKTHFPPLHFSCRCTFDTLTPRQAGRLGLTEKPSEVKGGEGFGGLPAHDTLPEGTACNGGAKMTPKTEIRLFVFGANDTEKGTFIVTPDDAKAVLAAWKARGTDLSWDYDHDVVAEGAQGPRPASGWSRLEVRKDGIWATGIRWTKRALGLIEAEEYRYFSPFFEHTEDGHVTNIVNVALTNIPATHGIDAIAASAKSKGKPAAPGARVVRGKLQEIPRSNTGRATDKKTRATALGKMTMTKEEMMKALAAINEQCAAFAAAIDGMGDDGEEKKETASDDEEKDKVAASADGDEMKSEAASAAAALCAFTGLKSPLKALAKVLSAGAASEEDDKAKLIDQGVAEGKLQPSLKPWAATLSVGNLRKFLGSAKAVVKTPESKDEAAKKGSSSTALSAAEEQICKNMGISREKFIAQRATLGGVK